MVDLGAGERGRIRHRCVGRRCNRAVDTGDRRARWFEDAYLEAFAVEVVEHRDRQVGHLELDVDAVAWSEYESVAVERRTSEHAIDRDSDRGGTVELRSDDSCVAGIDHSQADLLARPCGDGGGHGSVGRDDVAPPSVVGDVVHVVEALIEGPIGVEGPVIDHPHEVLVIDGLIGVDDNQASVEAALDLF